MPQSYPLEWPKGWPRTDHPRFSRFKITPGAAISNLMTELKRLGVRNVVISSNLVTRHDGLPYANRTQPEDTGVAVYFLKNDKEQCVPCDKWKKVEDNIWAVAKTIEALRGIERWGAKEMVDAAFRGFTALPSPDQVMSRTPREIIGVSPEMNDLEYITYRYKQRAKELHPDINPGDHAAMAELNSAYEDIKRELE